MKNRKDIDAQAQQMRVDMAMEAVLAFPNFMRWLLCTPSGLAAKPLSAEDRKAKYEDEFSAVLARVAEVAEDSRQVEPCGR